MKGILMLFEEPSRDSSENFYNPKIEKVEITIEGVPNQLYSQGMRAYQQWDEINKYFVADSKRDAVIGQVANDLSPTQTTIGQYLTNKYAPWLDLSSTDDNSAR